MRQCRLRLRGAAYLVPRMAFTIRQLQFFVAVAEKGTVSDKTVVKFRLTCQVTPDPSAN